MIAIDPEDPEPIKGFVDGIGEQSWSKEGKFWEDSEESVNDLVVAPESFKERVIDILTLHLHNDVSKFGSMFKAGYEFALDTIRDLEE